ncbi:ATP-binding protein [Paraburkholderia sp. 22B1P]|uniref:AlbA family DNA-binding domain-containing protein n=1 Tax=Paraburkholderia sp. 22B1P TaxID=3080498 RepID=UPI00308DEC75|nr:ATP-binding protein [Paraburkholderia sp. 22B1P]
MFNTLEDIQALIGVEVETVSLEFKDGAKLNDLEKAKTDLITDVTAFANAGGGTVIYGIREEKRGSQSYAGEIAPVTNERITQDRLRETILSNTDPVLRDFSITAIPAQGGTVFVIEVAEGDTAYQNKRDQKFYSRVDASAHPMYAFAIRDVMNRRTRPHVDVSLLIRRRKITSDNHIYVVVPVLENKGNLTAHHWILRLGVPAVIGRHDGELGPHMRGVGATTLGRHHIQWYQYSSERPAASTSRLLPGDTSELDLGHGYPEVLLIIGSESEIRATEAKPPLIWKLLLDDAPMRSGELPYEEWCKW